MSHARIVLFTGPTLLPGRAAALLDAAVLPPIKRGDLAPFLEHKPAAIGIIDGEFFQSLAVSTKEVLPFLEAGVQVYGSSSMGALRAMELSRYGMIGVGRVFRLFKSGILDADDEVAQTYCPSTYRTISEPLVNIRYILRAAMRHRIVSRLQAAKVLTGMKETYFPERTRRLLFSLVESTAGLGAGYRLRSLLDENPINVKEQDALLLIEKLRAGESRPARSTKTWEPSGSIHGLYSTTADAG